MNDIPERLKKLYKHELETNRYYCECPVVTSDEYTLVNAKGSFLKSDNSLHVLSENYIYENALYEFYWVIGDKNTMPTSFKKTTHKNPTIDIEKYFNDRSSN